MDYLDMLLEPISDDSYCGENLEDDAAFQNFFFTAKGTPERFDGENTIAAEAPDWRDLEKQALTFLEQTKDLKLMCILAQSVLNAKGIVPFSETLQALAKLLRKQWEYIYPLLDEDEGDPLERVASFSHLNDPFVINTLKNTPLANVKGVGTITLTEIDKAASESDDAAFNLSQIKGMFKEINTQELQLFYQAVTYSLESIEDINDCLVTNTSHEYSVDFEALNDVLLQLKKALESHANLQADDQTYESHDENVGDDLNQNDASISAENGSPNQARASVAAGPMTAIQSREDVEHCLGLINEYYANYEPSSPIPVLVNRAMKLVHKDFLAIIKDIYPDALSAVHDLGGTEPDEEDD